MKITVCQLHDARDAFAKDWEELLDHVKVQESELVLLPEMPFFQWFPVSRRFDAGVWRAAVSAHGAGEQRLAELAPARVLKLPTPENCHSKPTVPMKAEPVIALFLMSYT